MNITTWTVYGLMTALVFLIVGALIYGLVLAFKASIILGMAVLIIEPSPVIIGLVALCGHPEFCAKFAAWLNLPF